jgi:hypothetical protein
MNTDTENALKTDAVKGIAITAIIVQENGARTTKDTNHKTEAAKSCNIKDPSQTPSQKAHQTLTPTS